MQHNKNIILTTNINQQHVKPFSQTSAKKI